MPVSVTMPRLGESVTEGTVTRWLKQEGDRVEADEPLLEVSTDKVDTEIPSPAAGVLSRIVVQEDEIAEVGSELAQIDGDEAGGSAQVESGSAGTTAGDTAVSGGDAADAGDNTPEPAEPEPAAAQPAAAQPSAAGTAGAGAGGSSGGGHGGSTVVRMPALGESVTEGTVTRWLKAVGDSVEADEALLEVSTDKVDTEIPSPTAGTLLEIKVGEDEIAQVGGELAVIGESQGAEPAPQPTATALPGTSAATPSAEAEAGNTATSDAGTASRSSQGGVATAQPADYAPVQAGAPVSVRPAAGGQQPSTAEVTDEASVGYVTPLVRKLAAEHGVDLAALTGTGVGGRIRKQDVLEAAERQKAAAAERDKAAQAAKAQPAAAAAAGGSATPSATKAEPSPLRGRTEKLSRMRALIARRMVESLQVSAQLTTVVEVDVTRIAQLRDKAKRDFQATHGAKLTFLPFFALAAIEALRIHPTVNASIDIEAGTVTYHSAEHLGIAVDSERGLLVPVIHDAGDLNLAGLARRIADLAERTRGNKVTPDELSGGTFTLTNTGSRGALFDTPIINQPQVAILGTGAVVKRAVVVTDPGLGEVIVPRSMVYLALSYDHRLVDGADAARFLTTIKDRLEAGQFEAEIGLA